MINDHVENYYNCLENGDVGWAQQSFEKLECKGVMLTGDSYHPTWQYGPEGPEDAALKWSLKSAEILSKEVGTWSGPCLGTNMSVPAMSAKVL